MKKIIILLLAVILLSLPVLANNADNLNEQNIEDTARRELLESLSKGIIPVTPELSHEDFLSYMQIIDESDNKIQTSKFETFIFYISYYYYEGLSEDEVFERFANYVDSVDINDMEKTYTALFSMLDKFSYYMTEETSDAFFTPTAAKGIGIMSTWHEKTADSPEGRYITEVAKGSPAEAAGIKFNGVDITGLGYKASAALANAVASDAATLDVSLERDGVVTDYTLARTSNVYNEYTIELIPEKKLIYLDIDSFMYQSTVNYIGDELDRAWADGYRNIIIDLQGNLGGDVTVAAGILSKFTPKMEFLFSLGRKGETDSYVFASMGNGYDFDNIQILVDSSTASSSEVFAYTLRQIDSAKIIGSTTYGKGVAQTVVPFIDGATIGITTYIVYDENGKTYNEKGITPDVKALTTVTKNTLPSNLPHLTLSNYEKAVPSAQNKEVLALEMRLSIIGFLSSEKADGIWDDVTTMAIKTLQMEYSFEETGRLDKQTYQAIMHEVDAFSKSYYVSYSLYDYAYKFVPFA